MPAERLRINPIFSIPTVYFHLLTNPCLSYSVRGAEDCLVYFATLSYVAMVPGVRIKRTATHRSSIRRWSKAFKGLKMTKINKLQRVWHVAHWRFFILKVISRLKNAAFWSPLWSRCQSSWLQMQRSGFDSRHYQIFWEVVGLQRVHSASWVQLRSYLKIKVAAPV
jgi:hypothetical protein